jgi:guanidinoacetate N-methyltransferase
MEYTFNTNSITIPEGTIMHAWERPVMKELAKWACTNGGDIIEFGFGMGISASYIQQHNINSHTICERNPAVIKRLQKWAKDKPNVIILEGD